MPGEQETSYVGIASAAAVFLLITSICCVLSVSYTNQPLKNFNESHDENSTHHWEYNHGVPNLALSIVMLIGIVAMVIFMYRREDLSKNGRQCPLTSRHDRHSKYSLWSVTVFFVGVFILDFNYLVVEICCCDKWSYDCPYFLLNVGEVLFRVCGMVFTSCELIVCWIMKRRNFRPSVWIWLGVAVVQAANIALWFNLLLQESYHRNEDKSMHFDAYFTMCNGTGTLRNACFDSQHLFISSIPFLFPVTIEFSLLVSEAFLDRSIGAKVHTVNGAAGDPSHQRCAAANAAAPLVGCYSENERKRVLFRSQVFNLITVIVNIIYFMLSVLLLVAKSHPSKTVNNTFMCYAALHSLFLVCCCVAGILSSRRCWRQRSHVSFLEYLLLGATCGIMLQSIKRFAYFVGHRPNSDWIYVYFIEETLDTLQAPLQIALYFYAKDVKPHLLNVNRMENGPSRIAVFKCVMMVMFISNLVLFISDSFVFPETLDSVTPMSENVVKWEVFDNVVNPISIFFRFNSALLFFSVVSSDDMCSHANDAPAPQEVGEVNPSFRSGLTAAIGRGVLGVVGTLGWAFSLAGAAWSGYSSLD